MSPGAAAANSTRSATRLRTRCGRLIRVIVLTGVGVVLVPGIAAARRDGPEKNDWIGKRVVPRTPGFQLKIDNRFVHPRLFDIYRVEKADGPRLLLVAEREGLSGWAPADQVVPIEQAIEFFTDYVRDHPDDPHGYSTRAILWEREWEKLDLALGDYNEVIRLDPASPYGFNNRGRLWYAMKEYDRAVADYTEAIRLDPKEAIAYNNRGSAWVGKKEYDKAMADFDEAHRLNPAYAFPDFNRIYVLFAARQDGAVDAANRFLDLRGWRAHLSAYVAIMGHLAALRGDRNDQAKIFLDNAAVLCNRSTWPYPVVKYLRGEIDEARLLAAATDHGKMTEARCYLGLKLIQEKREKAALAHLHWVTEHGDPSFLEYTVARAELDRLTGR